MMLTENPTCSPVTNTFSTITCSYDYGNDILSVFGAIEDQVAGGNIIEFDVDSF